jgi:hypothetical protein
MKQPSEDTILRQKVVYDLTLPEGEIHLHPSTMARIEANATTVTVVTSKEPIAK